MQSQQHCKQVKREWQKCHSVKSFWIFYYARLSLEVRLGLRRLSETSYVRFYYKRIT
jgi:hypothetical protein